MALKLRGNTPSPLLVTSLSIKLTKTHILEVLQPIWLEKNGNASRLRGRIETILDYAKAKEFREGDNPAGWKGMLKPLASRT